MVWLWLAAALASTAARAEDSLIADTVEDVKLYFTAPLRWDTEDWIAFGATAAAVGVAHQFDGKVRSHFAKGPNDGVNTIKGSYTVTDALPALALVGGTIGYAVYLGDSDGYRETYSLLEAGGLALATSEVLGYGIGRERPNATTSPDRWRAGGSSFPSGHTSAAFAIGTVFAESGNDQYRWIRRILGYGMATYTGYSRVKHNMHWLSDTVASAALGIGSGEFILNRRDHASSSGQSSFDIEPTLNGWQLAYNVKFR